MALTFAESYTHLGSYVGQARRGTVRVDHFIRIVGIIILQGRRTRRGNGSKLRYGCREPDMTIIAALVVSPAKALEERFLHEVDLKVYACEVVVIDGVTSH